MAKKDFLQFEEARKYIHTLNLKTKKEWAEYCKSENKPDNIPYNPPQTYKDNGWKGWSDWLGTFTIANQNKEYLPFKDAKNFVYSLNLKTFKDWKNYCKSGNKPNNIPNWPNETYKDVGWISFGDWLGTFVIATFNRQYLTFEEARLYVHSLNLKSQIEWNDYRHVTKNVLMI